MKLSVTDYIVLWGQAAASLFLVCTSIAMTKYLYAPPGTQYFVKAIALMVLTSVALTIYFVDAVRIIKEAFDDKSN